MFFIQITQLEFLNALLMKAVVIVCCSVC